MPARVRLATFQFTRASDNRSGFNYRFLSRAFGRVPLPLPSPGLTEGNTRSYCLVRESDEFFYDPVIGSVQTRGVCCAVRQTTAACSLGSQNFRCIRGPERELRRETERQRDRRPRVIYIVGVVQTHVRGMYARACGCVHLHR